MAEVRYTGPTTAADLRAATTEAMQLQRSHGVLRFIVNSEDWDVRAGPSELDDILDKQYRGEGLARATRIAILLPRNRNARQVAAIYEEACRKRGWNAQICADRAAAMEWLTSAKRPQEARGGSGRNEIISPQRPGSSVDRAAPS